MQIGQFMEQKLYKRFFEIFEGVMRDCKYSTKLAGVPIQVSIIYICYHVTIKTFFLIHSVIMR